MEFKFNIALFLNAKLSPFNEGIRAGMNQDPNTEYMMESKADYQ